MFYLVCILTILWSWSRQCDESVKTKLPVNKIRSMVFNLFCSYVYKKNKFDFIRILWTCAFCCCRLCVAKRPKWDGKITRWNQITFSDNWLSFNVFAVDLHSFSLVFFSSAPCLWLIDTSGMMGHHSARAGLAAPSCDRSRWHSWVLERVHLLFALLLPALLLSNATKGEWKRREEMKGWGKSWKAWRQVSGRKWMRGGPNGWGGMERWKWDKLIVIKSEKRVQRWMYFFFFNRVYLHLFLWADSSSFPQS